ncbi:hypothetical protein R3Q56_004216 [Pseudomonas aeruginosa]|jgi:hypothetical protein|nr:hypothetical protein [Pseudomonas aeruginosa]
MSVTRTLEIQRSLQLDEKTMVTLRNFDVDWNCGTRFLQAMIKKGFTGTVVAQALSDVLFEYKILTQRGVSDYERLYFVLLNLANKLKEKGQEVPRDTLALLCEEATIPTPIVEELLNG